MDEQNHKEYRNKIGGGDQKIAMLPKPEYIIRIENKINQVIDRYGLLKKENEELSNKSSIKDEEIASLKKRVKELELNLENEKGKTKVDTGLGKPELEKKINEYIKEIDRCMAMLGEQD